MKMCQNKTLVNRLKDQNIDISWAETAIFHLWVVRMWYDVLCACSVRACVPGRACVCVCVCVCVIQYRKNHCHQMLGMQVSPASIINFIHCRIPQHHLLPCSLLQLRYFTFLRASNTSSYPCIMACSSFSLKPYLTRVSQGQTSYPFYPLFLICLLTVASISRELVDSAIH